MSAAQGPGQPGANDPVETALYVTDVAVGTSPYELVVTPDGTQVYVAVSGAGDVKVINTASNLVTETVAVGGAPQGVAVNPSGTKVYVANIGNGSMDVIDRTTSPNTFTVVPLWLSDPSGPAFVAVNPTGSRIYVSDQVQNTVRVFTASNTEILPAIALPSGAPNGLVVNPSGTRLYVASGQSVFVFDTTTRGLVDTISLSASVIVQDVAVNPSGTRVYAADQGGAVYVIDTATDQVVTSVRLPASSTPYWVAVSPDGSRAYVTDAGNSVLWTLDTATNTLLRADPVGLTPVGVAVSPDGTHLYVSDLDEGVVTVLLAGPILTGISPASGPAAGGNTITLTGTNLAGVTAVRVDGAQGTNIVVNPAGTQLTFTAPPGTGTVTVSVTSPAGDSNALTYTYTAAPTTTTLVSSANPSAPGAVVSFTATVAPVPPATGSPTGTVTFTVDGVPQAPVALVGGQATLTTSFLGGGTHTVSAHYNGSASFAPSTSNTLTVTVPPTGTTLTAAPAVATLGTDRQAHIRSLSATLTDQSGRPVAGQPVVFTIGGQQVAVATTDASGVATSTNVVVDPQFLLRSGSRYTATYNGGTAYQGSSASAGVTLS